MNKSPKSWASRQPALSRSKNERWESCARHWNEATTSRLTTCETSSRRTVTPTIFGLNQIPGRPPQPALLPGAVPIPRHGRLIGAKLAPANASASCTAGIIRPSPASSGCVGGRGQDARAGASHFDALCRPGASPPRSAGIIQRFGAPRQMAAGAVVGWSRAGRPIS